MGVAVAITGAAAAALFALGRYAAPGSALGVVLFAAFAWLVPLLFPAS